MGHVRNYVIGDICARYHNLKDEVIHPWVGMRLGYLLKMLLFNMEHTLKTDAIKYTKYEVSITKA